MLHKPLITLGLVLSTALAGAQTTLTPEALFESVSPSVWVVRTQDSNSRALLQGSAVVIGPGRLITNCHVLKQARTLSVGRENVSYGATLEHPDPERDLCQLRVSNFTAPAVQIAPLDSLRVGARVYAIGAPRGLETTISDGLLSGLRRDGRSDLDALQITVPISPGSSGGGLFDVQGRLIGITSSGLRDSQNLNFALPATWITEVPARAQAALAARSERSQPLPPAAKATGDRVFEYALKDRFTGNIQRVVYRLDRVEGDTRIFNQGTRVERAGGEVITRGTPIGGEFDLAMPPGGWIQKTPSSGSTWPLRYEAQASDWRIAMNLTARTAEESILRVGERELVVIRVHFKGHSQRGRTDPTIWGTYEANAWYSPELGRVVRFDAKGRGGVSGTLFLVDESLELVAIRAE
ncbi:serine protease [Hydrogenophaga sp. 2FB]|uniref:S1C family serine protease n=1 Tax=Hydrogenophaga sp. 2FB TaxID=2502187 RepID=UPI0010F44043|nr:serine protease [Hydrogenophaga sp. 2FB]